VMRRAGDTAHGRRLRGLIVVLWRAGLRIHEALALAEADLDARRGSLLVRRGKGGRRREVGMDDWAWEQLGALAPGARRAPRRAAVLRRQRPHARAAVGGRRRPRGAAPRRPPGRRAATLRAAPTPPRPCRRDGPRGRAAARHPTPTRSYQPRHHLDLPPGHRQHRNHRHRPCPPRPDDPRQRLPTRLNPQPAAEGARRPRLPVLVRLSSEGRHQAVREDCCFVKKQESPPALLVLVPSERPHDLRRDARFHGERNALGGRASTGWAR
jgi:hypothetical protein